MKNILKAVEGGEGLLFHHWDTDGMVSGAMILREIQEKKGGPIEERYTLNTYTPSIGNYLIDEEDRKDIEEIDPDFTIIVDMALPSDSIDFLKELGDLFIIDHHLQDRYDIELHHNPIIEGRSPKEYPSASWVLAEYLKRDHDLLSILGAFGDRETKLRENESAMETIDGVLKRMNTDFETLLRCVYLLDSAYKIGDRHSVTDMPWFLKDIERANEILERTDLKDNVSNIETSIQREIDRPLEEVKDGVHYLNMESSYNIISTVTRKLAWSLDEGIVIVSNSNFMDGKTQMYIRGNIPDSKRIIERAKERGYSAGGKSDVVGLVLPTESKESFLDEVLKTL